MTLLGDNAIAVESIRPIHTTSIASLTRLSWRRLKRRLAHFGFYYKFTSIAGRIVVLNIFSLLFLFAGMIYLSDFRDKLIGARAKSLQIEAEIIAKALTLESASAVSDGLDDIILGQPSDSIYGISIEKAAELLRSLIKPTKTHGFIYNADGTWLVDSNRIYRSGKLTQYQNPIKRVDQVGFSYKLWLDLERPLRETLPQLATISIQNGKNFAEVKAALEEGSPTLIARENELGETVLSYAVPIERGGAVLGALMLTTDDGEIDAILLRERISIFWLWVYVSIVMIVGSFILGGMIAGPMRRLAHAADSVRRNIKTRTDIPDFSHRSDEIGHLSRALREMTNTLYARLDAIENFAADVSHELKNPLTSMQSAIETLPLARRPEDRDRLIEIVRHDVRRMDRLITDISDASRLDAELARESQSVVNIVSVLDKLCAAQKDIHRDCSIKIEFQIKGVPRAVALSARSPFKVYGHERRLSQVICNLLDNALSFSPREGKIRISCCIMRKSKEIEITVEDEGPGVPPENLEKIFDRFYTDRPDHEEFGKNSGLGLNISRQIVTAHRGRIWAENRLAPPIKPKMGDPKPARVIGARFVIRLPVINRDG